ncbi:MAG: hypothetical protein FWG88_09970 [Oscillospiraceae bacterium]|nr:hypothetical protein [Oscillospiraceae bacterium]
MTFILLLLFGPIGGILLSTITVILTIWGIKKIRKTENNRNLKTVVCVACCMLLVFLFYIFFISDYSSPSKVDISPLNQLFDYPMYDLDELKERIELLNDVDGVERFGGHSWRGGSGREWTYTYTMRNRGIPASVNISFYIFDTPENAMDLFTWERTHGGRKYRLVKISNTIDALLFHSVMYRDADTLFNANSRRHLYTYVRLGNMVIRFGENLSEPRNIGQLTSKNLKLICDILTS